MGARAGGNLFFSFDRFDVGPRASVRFSAPPGDAVTAVIARVTGGPAAVNGALRCTIPDASVFLIDPAGVVFGPAARLDVGGSFAVATADCIRMADGTSFGLSTTPATLTTAAPTAFGFLSPRPAAVLDRASLAARPGKSLTLAGGGVRVAGGSLFTPGGNISLTAVAAPGFVPFPGGNAGSFKPGPAPSGGAKVALAHATVAVDGDGGTFSVRAGRVVVRSSQISAANTGAAPGGGIDVVSGGDAVLDSASLRSGTTAAGSGGPVRLRARSLTLSNSQVGATTDGPAAGGAIRLIAPTLRIDSTVAGAITTSRATGDGGAIVLRADDATVAGSSTVFTATNGPGKAGDVDVAVGNALAVRDNGEIGSTAQSRATGAGGDVNVNAGSLSVAGHALIDAAVDGRGDGGSVRVDVAGPLTLDGAREANAGGITSNLSPGATGRLNSVSVRADTLTVRGGDNIDSSTFGSAPGGDVSVEARHVLLDGRGTRNLTGIRSDTEVQATGASGRVRVAGGDVVVENGATVSATTLGAAAGGGVEVVADALTIDGGGRAGTTTGLFADAIAGGQPLAGAGGNLTVRAGSLRVTNGGQISADTTGTGRGGNVDVRGGDVVLDARGTPPALFTGVSADTLDPVGGGAGGRIHVAATSLRVSHHAAVQALSEGSGRGGSVRVDAGSVALQ